MKLLVRNLAKATTEEKLLNLFKEYGNVQSCNLVLDKETGASKGFAFVEMPKVGEAKAAIKQLNSYKLAGNLIRVKKADTKKEAAPETPAPKTEAVKKTAETDSMETAEMVDPAKVWGEVKDEIKE
ncbi:RNA recognition motif domain-containing protein [Psychromonas sp. 14N.309.X.WAT.B.A12]|jgi:RNA recognition motif-containing protein|uniref:RNA recognition motif domain-containing protein n=1 Tax=unclassified Psychromonas TaxID=2614957 RepID=UPI00339D390C